MSAAPRKDAVETLGTIIDETAGRDAIHIAVDPIVAGEDLSPGDHIGIFEGKAFKYIGVKVGIVDPFLREAVKEGQRFWLIVYPRTISSLRHVWRHPELPDPLDPATVEKLKLTAEVINRLTGVAEDDEEDHDSCSGC